MKDLQFDIKSSNSIPYNGVVIIDECSMINDILYEEIIKSCKSKNCKIIFQGDIKQILPVKQHTLAKTFNCENKSELTQIYRQSNENCVRNLLSILRVKPIYEFENKTSNDGIIEVFSNYGDLIKKITPLFESSIQNKNPNEIKLVAYTNKRVQAFNRIIRQMIFKENTVEFNTGDILFGYDGSSCNGYSIENSGDYQIQNAYKTTEYIGNQDMIG